MELEGAFDLEILVQEGMDRYVVVIKLFEVMLGLLDGYRVLCHNNSNHGDHNSYVCVPQSNCDIADTLSNMVVRVCILYPLCPQLYLM